MASEEVGDGSAAPKENPNFLIFNFLFFSFGFWEVAEPPREILLCACPGYMKINVDHMGS